MQLDAVLQVENKPRIDKLPLEINYLLNKLIIAISGNNGTKILPELEGSGTNVNSDKTEVRYFELIRVSSFIATTF